MIDKTIEDLSMEFVARVNQTSTPSLVYSPDESLLSLSILDLFFSPEHYQGTKDNLALDILRASSYVGIVSYKIFKSNSATVKLTFTSPEGGNNPTVLLSVLDYPAVGKKWKTQINITRVISKTIFSKERIFYTQNEAIPLGLQSNKLWFVSLGIASGLHPSYEDKSETSLEDVLEAHIHTLCTIGSEQYSLTYLSALPGKENLFSAELFYPDLAFPPPGYDEIVWGERTLLRLHEYLKARTLTNENIIEIAHHLIESPNIHHAVIASILLITLKVQKESMLINELMYQYPLLPFQILPSLFAYMNLRKEDISFESLLMQPDGKESETKKDTSNTHEYDLLLLFDAMGLFPLLLCPERKLLSEHTYKMYFELILQGLSYEALLIGEDCIQSYERAPGILIQQIYLLLQLQKMEDTKRIFSLFPDNMSKEETFLVSSLEYISMSRKSHTRQHTQDMLALLTEFSTMSYFPGKIKIGKLVLGVICTILDKEETTQTLMPLLKEIPEIISMQSLSIIHSRFNESLISPPPVLRRTYWSAYRFHARQDG
jgi:hypothetical protein